MLSKRKLLFLLVIIVIVGALGEVVHKKYKNVTLRLSSLEKNQKEEEILNIQKEEEILNIQKEEEILNIQKEEEILNIQKEAIKISDSYWDKKYESEIIKKKYKVAMIMYGGGEYSYAEYFKYAAEKRGWTVRIYYRNKIAYEEEILNFDPDFIMFTNQYEFILDPKLKGHRSKKYILSLSPFNQDIKGYLMLSDNVLSFSFPFQDIFLKADGMFSAIQEIDILRSICENNNKEFNGFRLIPSVPYLDYESAEPKSLMWYGMAWAKDSRYTDDYKSFIKLLSKNVPMKVYGFYNNYTYLEPNVYDGYIPSAMDIIDTIRANGIYLLTHSNEHIKSGVPSLRIFEAAAANVAIISDKHPFIIENFGDNILYFDQTADPETMYKQVKEHVDWILAHPKEAKAMAEKVHQIFLEKFTLDKDLDRIAKMHEYILRQDKEKGLRYPLVY